MTDSMLSRLAVLVEIAERRSRKGRFGKTAAQKFVYLLQETTGFDWGYRFDLYTYGPYDATVMRDIDYGEAIGALVVKYEGEQGYSIAVGPNASELQVYRDALVREHGSTFDQLFDAFGSMSAKELELHATIVYVARDQDDLSDQEIAKIVQEIKPRFDHQQIRAAVHSLRSKGYLKKAGMNANSCR